MGMSYWLIPRMKVQGANAVANAWILNHAPISAAVLFGHAVGRRLQEPVQGVGYIHHHAEHLGEMPNKKGQYEYLPQQRRASVFIDKNDYDSKNKRVLSLQPTASCHLTMSLILAFDESIIDPNDLNDALYGGRFAGGQITGHGEPQLFEDESELRASLPLGYWLIERMDLISVDEPLESLLETLYPEVPDRPKMKDAATSSADIEDDSASEEDHLDDPKENQGEHASSDRAWLVPTTLGYAAITPFDQRAHVRGDPGTAHAFCEPLVGLVQYRHTRQTPSELPLWRHQWLSDDIFVYTQLKGSSL